MNQIILKIYEALLALQVDSKGKLKSIELEMKKEKKQLTL